MKETRNEELELNSLENQRQDYIKTKFEIEKILNEKFLYILSGGLALAIASSQNNETINNEFILGVSCFVFSLILYFANIVLSLEANERYIEVLDNNYKNFYNKNKWQDYPEELSNLINLLSCIMLTLFCMGVISLSIYYLN